MYNSITGVNRFSLPTTSISDIVIYHLTRFNMLLLSSNISIFREPLIYLDRKYAIPTANGGAAFLGNARWRGCGDSSSWTDGSSFSWSSWAELHRVRDEVIFIFYHVFTTTAPTLNWWMANDERKAKSFCFTGYVAVDPSIAHERKSYIFERKLLNCYFDLTFCE